MKNKKTLKIAIPTILGAGLAAAVPFALTSCSSKPATPTMDIAETGMTQSSFEAFYNEFSKGFGIAESKALQGSQVAKLFSTGFDITSEQITNAPDLDTSKVVKTSGTNFIGLLKLLGLKNFTSVNVKLLNDKNGELNKRQQFILPLQISINFNNDINLVNGESQWDYVVQTGQNGDLNNVININKNVMTIKMDWTAFSFLIPNLTVSNCIELAEAVSKFKFPSSITSNQNFVVNNTSNQFNELNKIINLPNEVVKSYNFILPNQNTKTMNLVIEFNSGFILENSNNGDYQLTSPGVNGTKVGFWPQLNRWNDPVISGATPSTNAGIVIENIPVTNTPAK